MEKIKSWWCPTFGKAARLCCLTSQRTSSFWNWRHFSTFNSGTRIRIRTRSGSPELIDSSSMAAAAKIPESVKNWIELVSKNQSDRFKRVSLIYQEGWFEHCPKSGSPFQRNLKLKKTYLLLNLSSIFLFITSKWFDFKANFQLQIDYWFTNAIVFKF